MQIRISEGSSVVVGARQAGVGIIWPRNAKRPGSERFRHTIRSCLPV